MNENNGKPDPEQGLYRKYEVNRIDDKAEKHADCQYFVLDLDHDPHSVAALEAYAESCKAQYPTLAFDLRHTAAAAARKLGVSARPEALRIPRATLEKWHESLGGHRADSSDEAAWNNYGVIEVDDQIQKLLAESPLRQKMTSGKTVRPIEEGDPFSTPGTYEPNPGRKE